MVGGVSHLPRAGGCKGLLAVLQRKVVADCLVGEDGGRIGDGSAGKGNAFDAQHPPAG